LDETAEESAIAITSDFSTIPEILAASLQHSGNNCLDIPCSGFWGTGVSPVFPDIAVEQFYLSAKLSFFSLTCCLS
jgi:hypothetical protein